MKWQPIETAPRDGTVVRLKCAARPEFGEHAMKWSQFRMRWEGVIFAPMRRIYIWWDEKAEQPTHWRTFETAAPSPAATTR